MLETRNISKMTMIFDMMKSLQNDYYHDLNTKNSKLQIELCYIVL